MKGFYVDDNGFVCSAEDVAPGMRHELRDDGNHAEIWIVADDGRVDGEHVLWNSLAELEAAGVDVSVSKINAKPDQILSYNNCRAE